MKRSFFPKAAEFWFYHFGGIIILLLIESAYFSFSGSKALLWFHIIANIAWVFAFTLAVLVFRKIYNDREWGSRTTAGLFLKCIVFGAAISLVTVALLVLVSWPFFDDMHAMKLAVDENASFKGVVTRFSFANWIQTQLYFYGWAFIYMSITNGRRAKKAEVDNLRLQNSLKEAKLSSLSNQLNPHFLFNALNNIRFMIHENAANAERMIMSLSEVLRYSLESSKHEKLPLDQEIAIIDKYIDIIKVQFEDRLVFEKDILARLHKYLVPPMILQMLVENAVKHGLEKIRQGSVISIAARVDEAALIFTVSNDLPDKPVLDNANTGIGLRNIRQRLSLLYAESAHLTTDVVDGKFLVSVTLPKEQ